MAFLTEWSYRKSFLAISSSGAVTNYQVKILVGESSGATGEVVDCGGLCKTDFSDIRFTSANGTTLDYWVESITGTTPNQLATIWVELDSIGTSNTTFYMYYGKVDATAVSSGANTFLFFDDFEYGNLNKWSTRQEQWAIQSVVKVLGSNAVKGTGAGSNRVLASNAPTYVTNFALHYWVRANSTTLNHLYALLSQDTLKYPLVLGGGNAGNEGKVTYYDGVYKDFSPPLGYSANIWHEVTLFFDLPNHQFKVDFDGTETEMITTVISTGTVNDIDFYISATTGDDSYLDGVFTRKWVATEPSISSWAMQESSFISPFPTFFSS